MAQGDEGRQSIHPTHDLSVVGRVTAIQPTSIRGWAHDREHPTPVTVQLCVDGTPVNETVATQPVRRHPDRNGGHIGFRFGMEQIWTHLAAGQEIRVQVAGRPLPMRLGSEPTVVDHVTGDTVAIDVRETSVLVLADGARASQPLVALIHAGQLINKKGRLQEPTHVSADWASRALPEYRRIERLLSPFGKRPYVFYGAMLGFARDGGIMAHDLDLDLAYLSDETEPDRVRDEFAEICEHVISANPRAKPFSYKLQFPGRRISLTPTWFTDGAFFSTFGFVGGASVEPSDILPLQPAEHAGTRLWLPNRPATVARYLYGPGWEYPDRGWVWRDRYLNWPTAVAARLDDGRLEHLLALRRRTRRRGAT